MQLGYMPSNHKCKSIDHCSSIAKILYMKLFPLLVVACMMGLSSCSMFQTQSSSAGFSAAQQAFASRMFSQEVKQ
jgi:hypothetical protein